VSSRHKNDWKNNHFIIKNISFFVDFILRSSYILVDESPNNMKNFTAPDKKQIVL